MGNVVGSKLIKQIAQGERWRRKVAELVLVFLSDIFAFLGKSFSHCCSPEILLVSREHDENSFRGIEPTYFIDLYLDKIIRDS